MNVTFEVVLMLGLMDNATIIYSTGGPIYRTTRSAGPSGGGRVKSAAACTGFSVILESLTRLFVSAFSLDMIARRQKQLISQFWMLRIA